MIKLTELEWKPILELKTPDGLKIPNGTIVKSEDGIYRLFGDYLAGSVTEGCACCSALYSIRDFGETAVYATLEFDFKLGIP